MSTKAYTSSMVKFTGLSVCNPHCVW